MQWLASSLPFCPRNLHALMRPTAKLGTLKITHQSKKSKKSRKSKKWRKKKRSRKIK